MVKTTTYIPMACSEYWAQFTPAFVRNERRSYFDEFQRLAGQRNWREGSKRYKKEWARCCEAEFRAVYNDPNASKLDGWKMLCADVGYRDIPNSITQCRKLLSTTFVNLVDLVEARAAGKQGTRFSSRKKLRDYIHETGKVFPKHAAKSDGFLKELLIDVF